MHRLLLLMFFGLGRLASAQVILTEVMFNPRGNENAYEFLEIYNTSATDSISVAGWKIGDQNETDLLVSPDGFYKLAPGQFAIVLDPGYFQTIALYDSLIPAQALILTIDDNSFGSGGLSNSTAETIIVLDAGGRTVARYTYSLDNPDGISDEKRFLNADDSPGNWANSRRIDGSPGQRNSVTPSRLDGELVARSFSVSPSPLRVGQTATLAVTLRNNGLQTLATAAVEFSIMSSSANLTLPVRLGSVELPFPLKFADSIRLSIDWNQTVAGRHEIFARLKAPGDENSSNDTLRAKIAAGYPREIVRINEIMYAPPANQPEWIELFNPQPNTVALADWVLQDESNTGAAIKGKPLMQPQSYLVLAASPTVAVLFKIADSLVVVLENFPTLNNTGDVLLLRDFSGAVIDSAAYQTNWGAPGVSAEKIRHERENVTANWRPSQDSRGGTPAALNSVSPRDIDLAAIRLQFDPPQPRAGDDVHLIAAVRNAGRRRIESFTVTFAFDRNQDNAIQTGEEIGVISVTQPIASEDSTVIRQLWRQPPSGRHRILAAVFTTLDAVSSNNRTAAHLPVGYGSRSVVINEIYYAPRSGEVEWVEFYNRSNQAVDLSAWRWRDAGADFPVALPDSNLFLPPGEFAVLAAGRNLANADSRVRIIVPKTWFTLNNDRDTLVLADFNGRVQDSLSFSQRWGGDNGISLERINPNLASADSSNWSSCVEALGSTPGKRNSIFTELVPKQAAITVSPQPFSPDGDGRDDFAIIQFQVPAATATVHVKIYDLRGRLVHQLLNNAPVGASSEVIWNGRDENHQPAPMGIYIVYLQAIQATGGVLVEARTTLVLAGKLD
ncbi:MAG: lamin tail domain-containing protein [candidate division KSB1 bacterium]|nr:lamin tail domain-containing protein [candidate division KSB1 bacterium]MDZ7365108.1 lamin tail domain-containing protein [candidate division KSB1 bacterium]MDZ7404318.1 lamin tail domain-containing protein [candidate division KSB1 bacterium]